MSHIHHLKHILANLDGDVYWDEPLSKHTSVRVGGPVDAYVRPKHVKELGRIFSEVSRYQIPYLVLGDGSNIIPSDEGFRGVAFNLSYFNDLKVLKRQQDLACVYVGAGLRKQALLSWAASEGLSGIEFLSGVPGQIGGGLFMNAGTFEGSFGDITEKIFMIKPDGYEEIRSVNGSDFSYRAQSFCQSAIITAAVVRLQESSSEAIMEKVRFMIQDRRMKQPLQFPNCGSTFTNPSKKSAAGVTAGKLIESAGLKGYRVGGAMVSEKHANFIINTGKAKARDVVAIMKYVEEKVREVHGISLKREVVVLGG